jgi:hypothetical protein
MEERAQSSRLKQTVEPYEPPAIEERAPITAPLNTVNHTNITPR